MLTFLLLVVTVLRWWNAGPLVCLAYGRRTAARYHSVTAVGQKLQMLPTRAPRSVSCPSTRVPARGAERL